MGSGQTIQRRFSGSSPELPTTEEQHLERLGMRDEGDEQSKQHAARSGGAHPSSVCARGALSAGRMRHASDVETGGRWGVGIIKSRREKPPRAGHMAERSLHARKTLM